MNARVALLLCSILAAVVTGGCADTMTRSSNLKAAIASPTATMRWNEFASDLITRNLSGQQGSVRVFAYLNLAINNAIVHRRVRFQSSERRISRSSRCARSVSGM